MGLFHTDSLVLCYSNLNVARHWWIATFDCRQVNVPAAWDDPLPSDVALSLPGDSEPTILLCDKAEVREAGYARANDRPLVFCTKLTKAREYLDKKGATPGPIQNGGGPQFFEILDPEGNTIEICKES